MDKTIVLASGSAVRAAMLRAAGVAVEVAPQAVDERRIERALIAEGRSAAAIAAALASAKAAAAQARRPDALIVAADQVLVAEADGPPLGKVADRASARARLWALRGRTHWLETAAEVRGGEAIQRSAARVAVRLRAFDAAALDGYLDAAGEAALRSVACYEIEGLGARLIEGIEGDYFSALGLPLFEVLAALRALGGVRF